MGLKSCIRDKNCNFYNFYDLKKKKFLKISWEGGREEWPAGDGQLCLAAVSLIHSLSNSRPLFSKSFFINFYDFFRFLFLQNIMGREEEWGGQHGRIQRGVRGVS